MGKRIGMALIVILVVATITYLSVSYTIYNKLSRATHGGGEHKDNTPSSFQVTAEKWKDFDESPYFMQEYEEVRFPSRQAGLDLAGWYIPGEPNAPAIILTHGLNGCKCQPNVLTAAGMLHHDGFHVLVYDLREHGESDIEDGRVAVGNEEYMDLLGAWDWLVAERGFAPDRIGVYGQSFGAATTLIAFSQEARVAAAFVDSPYTDLPTVMEEELARNDYPTFFVGGAVLVARVVAGDDLLAHSPSDALQADAGRPIYIVHGTGDTRVDVHHTRDLAEWAVDTGANVYTWIPGGIGHVEAEFTFPDEYAQRLTSFFHQALHW